MRSHPSRNLQVLGRPETAEVNSLRLSFLSYSAYSSSTDNMVFGWSVRPNEVFWPSVNRVCPVRHRSFPHDFGIVWTDGVPRPIVNVRGCRRHRQTQPCADLARRGPT